MPEELMPEFDQRRQGRLKSEDTLHGHIRLAVSALTSEF